MTNLRGRRRVRSTAGGLIASAAAGALLLAGIGISLRLGEPIRTVQIIGDLTAEQRARISQVVEPSLPHLHGPDGSAPLVLEHYFFAREMAARLGLIVTDLMLDPADGWGIVFDSGLALRLGHNDAIARMQLFQLLYLERLANEAGDIAVVDARYANAVAVTRKADVGEHQILAAASRFGSHDGD
ncbi:MAG: cell division protein FtsQ/DivIB [Gammaproteobacteria bacterium]